jgi:Xaa-Pro aminopeptidase
MPTDWNEVRHELDTSFNYADITNTPWYADAEYDRFSDAEFHRRHDAARSRMERERLDALILTGSPNIYSLGSGVTWGCGLIDDRGMCQYLVLPREGRPTLIYPHDGCHLEAVRKMVSIADVRGGQNGHFGKAIAGRLREVGVTSGRIGVTAVDRNGPEYMGVATYLELRRELPDVEIVFAPDLLHELTYRKSDEELDAMRRAGRLAVAAQAAVARAARPGVREYELAAAGTAAILAGGGRVHLMMIGSTPMDRPRIMYPNPNPSHRALQHGDLILTEISAAYLGYSAKLGHPIAIGAPTAEMARFHRDVTLTGFATLKDALAPGTALTELQKVSDAFRRAGAQSRPITLHGIDLITAGPKVMVHGVVAHDYDSHLIDGMVVNVEATPIAADGVWGSFLSRTYAISKDGIEDLTPTAYPLDELLTVSQSSDSASSDRS